MVKTKKAGRTLARRLGANIGLRRRARKWSQEDLAERLGVTSETISRFERGATLPSLLTLQEIAKILKAPLAELLANSSEAPDDQAAVIAAWISDLRDQDRVFVVDLVKSACDHFRQKNF